MNHPTTPQERERAELDEMCPDHDRDSCSDEAPSNAGVDLRYGKLWCRRCEGLWRIKARAALASEPMPAVEGLTAELLIAEFQSAAIAWNESNMENDKRERYINARTALYDEIARRDGWLRAYARPIEARYRFLMALLIDRGVLTDRRYNNGTWSLQGIYGIDDSGLRGAGTTPEEAIDNAIIAARLDPKDKLTHWRETHESITARPAASSVPAQSAPAAPVDDDFWQWLPKAYRDSDANTSFTAYNMEVAFQAGRTLPSDLEISAVEELHQLGYTVRNGMLYPPATPAPAAQVVPSEACEHNLILPNGAGRSEYCVKCGKHFMEFGVAPAAPAQGAGMTDAEIDERVREIYVGQGPRGLMVALRAALAARPAASSVPMTDEQILHFWETRFGYPCEKYPLKPSEVVEFARAIEAHHGIPAPQGKEDTPS